MVLAAHAAQAATPAPQIGDVHQAEIAEVESRLRREQARWKDESDRFRQYFLDGLGSSANVFAAATDGEAKAFILSFLIEDSGSRVRRGESAVARIADTDPFYAALADAFKAHYGEFVYLEHSDTLQSLSRYVSRAAKDWLRKEKEKEDATRVR